LVCASAVFLFLVSALFSQSSFRRPALDERIEKLEPALYYIERATRRDQRVPVIIQFNDETVGGARSIAVEVPDEEERRRIVLQAGGSTEESFSQLPAVAARVDASALNRLARDPRVSRISLDHPVYGATSTTALAVGADQIWEGSAEGYGIV